MSGAEAESAEASPSMICVWYEPFYLFGKVIRFRDLWVFHHANPQHLAQL